MKQEEINQKIEALKTTRLTFGLTINQEIEFNKLKRLQDEE